MDFIKRRICGLWIIKPNIIFDERGYSLECYKKCEFEQYIGEINFVQENLSRSFYCVLRGMHYQKGNNAQAKLVSVLDGIIQDVAVDLRKNSSSFGEYELVELSDKNRLQFFIPRGFAHGFLVLSNVAVVSYKVDNVYCPNSEMTLYAGDKDLNISWAKGHSFWKQSNKDCLGKSLKEIEKQL
jgi:dTDP-4-dehydrorhamnose 3,5-epimerase